MISTQKLKTKITQPETQRYATAEQLILFGKSQGWEFRILGKAPIPRNPVSTGKWLIVPGEQDESNIPFSANDKLNAILQAGLFPKAYVVVHEIPKEPKDIEDLSTKMNSRIKDVANKSKGIVETLGATVSTLVTGTLKALPLILGVLVAPLLLIDPILVAVTEYDEWVEIERWDC